ncbi:hypothetical protein [Haliangium sp.]|uniref:hypothetical protein n=1 Tax=Haliangium sp. TaxID=2663208 RepID=UPI003D10EC34
MAWSAWPAAVLVASLAAGCASPREEPAATPTPAVTPTPTPTAGADEVVMTRGQACYQVVMEVCKARPGCAWSHPQREYQCRNELMFGCCREDDNCDEEVVISSVWLSECFRQLELEYDCNRLFTPACQRVIPGPQDSQRARSRPDRATALR